MTTQYKTIVADPPWPYKAAKAMPIRDDLSNRGTAKGHGSSVMAYGQMSIGELCKLEVLAFVAPNAHLYLWTTNAFMEEAFAVAQSWGFKQKTIITWTKVKKDGTPSMKMGYYYRGATEHCLFCTRGKQRLIGPAASTAILTTRLPHSVKPDEFYKLVEEQSPGPRLEMFARQPRPGWASWGNELQNDVDLLPSTP